MGIAQQLEQIIRQQLRAHAAWLPISNNYKLGDYGIIANGVFNTLGNVQQDFGVTFDQAQGADVALDFTSESTSIKKFAGGAQVDVIPAGAIDAKISLKFEKERALLIKAPVVTVTAIENVKSVFNQLKTQGEWHKRNIIVFQTYSANDANIISTIDAGTEIIFSGNASALEQFKLANASVDINSNKRVGLQLVGKSGVIALGLVRLRNNFTEKPIVFLGPDDEIEVEQLDGTILEDDL